MRVGAAGGPPRRDARAVAHPERPARFRRAARFALGALAATLALGGVLLGSAPAEAQEAAFVVSNTGQGQGGELPMSGVLPSRAQAFTTGTADGYELGSIGVRFATIAGTSTAGDAVTVTLNADNNGVPGGALCTLNDPSSFASDAVNTFFAPTACPRLAASTTYFVVITRVAFDDGSGFQLRLTGDTAEDAVGAAGWSIGNSQHFFSSGSWSSISSEALMIEIEAQEVNVLVSNTGQSQDGIVILHSRSARAAQAFTIGTAGGGYTLSSIGVRVSGIADDNELAATLNEEDGGVPGDALCTLDDPSSFTSGAVNTFEAPATCPTLAASTTYFVVITRVAGDAAPTLTLTDSRDEDAVGAAGWSIGNSRHFVFSGSWSTSSGSDPLMIEIEGVALPARVTGFALDGDNGNPTGVWGDDETIWVGNNGVGAGNKIFAYKRSDGSRDSGKDFDSLNAAGNESVRGICSDGTTMFVTDATEDKVYAYKMSDTTRDSAKDITLTAANTRARGVWCDGDTVWVANDAGTDGAGDKIFAYKRSDGTHDSAKDMESLYVSTAAAGDNATWPRGLWSDGTTMFVADPQDNKVYAFKLSDESQDSAKNIKLDDANAEAYGLWFDGRVLWVVDLFEDRFYTYDLPGAQPENTPAVGDPEIRTTTDVWTATLTAGVSPGSHFPTPGYQADTFGSLSPGATFSLGGVTYTVFALWDSLPAANAGTLNLILDTALPREFTISVAGESFSSTSATKGQLDLSFTWEDANLSWSADDTIPVVLSVESAPREGVEVTADVSGITDADGLAHALFHYQWFRVDGTTETELAGETGATYVPTADDVDKHLKVRVIFDDDDGNRESPRTSPQVGPVVVTPEVTVEFGQELYSVDEGESVTVNVQLSEDPKRQVVVPLVVTNKGDAAGGDYSGVPASVTFQSGETAKSFTFSADQDTYDDDGESVVLGFGTLPERVTAGTTNEATFSIIDDDDPAPVLVKNTGLGRLVSAFGLSDSIPSRAQAFTTGTAGGYALSAIGISFLDIASTSTAGADLTVTLTEEDDGVPGAALCTLNDPSSFTANAVNTFDAPAACPALAASTTYFVVVTRVAPISADTIDLAVADRRSEDSGAAAGWSIGNSRHFLRDDSWNVSRDHLPHQIEVRGATIPAPVLVKNTGLGRLVSAFGLSDSIPSRAQAFTTGTAGGYALSAIGISFLDIASTSTAGADLTVTLTEEDDGVPGAALCTLNDPSSFTANAVNTFDAPAACPALAASTTYFVVVTRVAPISADTIDLAVADRRSEDSGAAAGWSIGNSRHFLRDDSWNVSRDHLPYQIEVRGATIPAPTVSVTPESATVSGGGTVTLDGTASDGALSFAWSSDGGGTFADDSALDTTWTAPAATQAEQVVTLTLTVTDDGDASATAEVEVTVLANQAPTVSVTPESATVRGGGTVTLDGTAADPEGDGLSFAWSSNGGGTFADDSALDTVWTAPAATQAEQVLTLTLTVTDDGDGRASATAEVEITVLASTSQAPVVSAGAAPGRVRGGGTVTLDGTASDPEGDGLSFAWSSDGGGTFADAAALDTTWTAPAGLETEQVVTLTLTVTDDGGGGSATAEVEVTVLASTSQAPTVSVSVRVRGGGTVSLGGTASDADGDGLSYFWSSDGGGTFADAAALDTTWTAPAAAQTEQVVTLTLTVTDDGDDGASSTAELRVTVLASTNQAPVVSAVAAPGRVSGGGTVSLGGAAFDPEGDGLSYFWSSDGGGTFADASALDTTWTAPAATQTEQVVNLTLTVTDDGGGSASATVRVVVAPLAPAGATVTPSALDLVEGGSGSYSVALDHEPTGNVTITITAGGSVTTDPTTLRFTPSTWSNPQTVTVRVAQDADASAEFVTITHTVADGSAPEYLALGALGAVRVSVTDDDQPGVRVSRRQLTVAEGATATYTVVLVAEPSETVRVSLAPQPVGITGRSVLLDTYSLEFTPTDWNVPQTVTIDAVPDGDGDDDIVPIRHLVATGSAPEYVGLNIDTLYVTVTDPDAASRAVLTISTPDQDVVEGGSVTITVNIDRAADYFGGADVRVGLDYAQGLVTGTGQNNPVRPRPPLGTGGTPWATESTYVDLVIGGGDTSTSFTISVRDDSVRSPAGSRRIIVGIIGSKTHGVVKGGRTVVYVHVPEDD